MGFKDYVLKTPVLAAVCTVGSIITILVVFKTCGYDIGALRADLNHIEKDNDVNEVKITKIDERLDVIDKKTDCLSTDIENIKSVVSTVEGNMRDLWTLRTNIEKAEIDYYMPYQGEYNEYRTDMRREVGAAGSSGSGSTTEIEIRIPGSYKGRVGIITQKKGVMTASGFPYDPTQPVAAINLKGRLKDYRFGSKFIVTNSEYVNGKAVTVEVVDTFRSQPDILLAVSPAAAETMGFPLEKGLLKAEVHENPE